MYYRNKLYSLHIQNNTPYVNSPLSKWHFFNTEPNTFLTNNCSESLNAMIKRDWTNRERKPFHIFLRTLKDCIFQLSLEKKTFQSEIEANTNLQTAGANLQSKNLFVNFKEYYFLKKKQEEGQVSMSQARRFVNLTYTNLKDFKSDCLNLIVLKFNNSPKSVTCFYNSGFKYGVCVHKVALEIHLKLRQKIVLLVPKKKRGRKRKAAPALSRQEDEERLKPSQKRMRERNLPGNAPRVTITLSKKTSQKK